MAHMVSSSIETNYVDKRRSGTSSADSLTHYTTALVLATANGAGTTTTLVYPNATPATNANMLRVGDSFRLFNSAGAVKEEKVFRVTSIAVAASNTATFTPAAAVVTALNDVARQTGLDAIEDEDSLDRALLAINSGNSYTQARLNTMNQNDKVYALRIETDASGV